MAMFFVFLICVLLESPQHRPNFAQAAKHATTNFAAADEITRNLERLARRTREDAGTYCSTHRENVSNRIDVFEQFIFEAKL